MLEHHRNPQRMMDYESRLRDVESGLQTEDSKFRFRNALKMGLCDLEYCQCYIEFIFG